MAAIPLFVVKALAQVREGGEVNMLDRRGVEALVGSERAAEWLNKASNAEYMEALNEMGEYISVPDYSDTLEDDDDGDDTLRPPYDF